jgi:hypothetical protein
MGDYRTGTVWNRCYPAPPGFEGRGLALQLENPPNPELPRERKIAARSLSGRIERF